MNDIWILAQTEGNGGIGSTAVTNEGQPTTTTQGDTPTPSNGQNQGGQNPTFFIFLMVMMVLMVFMLFRAPQKQKQERKKLEQSLEKGDKVLTIGGIFGNIIDIKEEEVTLKIDESNNTKIKVRRSAIGRNLTKEKA